MIWLLGGLGDHSTEKHLCLFSHGGSHVTAWAEGKLRINFA